MSDLVKDTLEGTQKALRKEKAAGNAAMIDDAVSKMSENERAKVHTCLLPGPRRLSVRCSIRQINSSYPSIIRFVDSSVHRLICTPGESV